MIYEPAPPEAADFRFAGGVYAAPNAVAADFLLAAPAATIGQSTQFGAPSLVSVHRVQEGVQLLPFIPPLIAGYTATFGAVVAQQEQPIAAPVFGTPSVSFSTTHPATSIEATAAFGVPVAQSIHAAQSLEPVVFGAIGDPAYSAQASSLSGQTAFGQPVSATVHPAQDWYAGIRMGPLDAKSFGSFPVLDGIQLTEFGEPRLGATAHGAMSLHLMPQFGPITISRGAMQC